MASNAELQKKVRELEKQLAKSKKTGIVALPVDGTFLAEWTNDLTGQKMRRKVEFRPGARGLRLRGHNGIFPTEAIIGIANGKKPTKADLEECPDLKHIDQAFAAKELTHLAIIGYGLLKDHPVEAVEEEPAEAGGSGEGE